MCLSGSASSSSWCLSLLLCSCSSVEQPDVVFSVEQVRCRRSEADSPALAPAERDAIMEPEPDPEVSVEGSSPSGDEAELKQKPEELLQLTPEPADVVPLTGEAPQRLLGDIRSFLASGMKLLGVSSYWS